MISFLAFLSFLTRRLPVLYFLFFYACAIYKENDKLNKRFRGSRKPLLSLPFESRQCTRRAVPWCRRKKRPTTTAVDPKRKSVCSAKAEFDFGRCPTLRMTYPCPTFKKPMCENTQIPIQLFTLTQCVNISRLPNGKHFTFAKANISHSPSEVSISRLPTANI